MRAENRHQFSFVPILTALLALPLMANANTYTSFAVSGTDMQEQSITPMGVSGCTRLECNNYAPGTFSGTATIDTSTDTIDAATITTCCQPDNGWQFAYTWSISEATQNLDSGLNLLAGQFGHVPFLSLNFDLSNDTVTGAVSGGGGSGESGYDVAFTTNMVGTLKPVAAPEMDPASAGSALTVLGGVLMLLSAWRGRAQKQAAPRQT